eukprot:Clim_evm4s240 gene=Clim_evmTU4s240
MKVLAAFATMALVSQVAVAETGSKQRPNFLFIVTDEERQPPAYTPEDVKEWINNLPGKTSLDKFATHFVSHRTSATACTPSRTTLYTGHVPAVHGVSQTYGIGKEMTDPGMSWLDVGTLPTMGDYFRAAGYDTYYIGKWHISYEDLQDEEGYIIDDPDPYRKANVLDKFGWNRWIGPEPHGAAFKNTGWMRDPEYIADYLDLIKEKEEEAKKAGGADKIKPFIIALNLVNPHDIVFPDMAWRAANKAPLYDNETPKVPLAPTHRENLLGNNKPPVQTDYLNKMGLAMFYPLIWTDFMRFYLFLIKEVDRHIKTAVQAIDDSVFGSNTIILHTADHGDMQGAHGGMIQKWHQAYEETVNIPLVVRDPRMDNASRVKNVTEPTQSIDILPTMFDLADIKFSDVAPKLKKSHSEVHEFKGRSLAKLMKKATHDTAIKSFGEANPTYYQYDDQITNGKERLGAPARINPVMRLMGNWEYDAVEGTVNIEGIVFKRDSDGHVIKFSRYYDDPQYWSEPFVQDVYTVKSGVFALPYITDYGKTRTKTVPYPEEYEIYDLANDPYEEYNLAATTEGKAMLKDLLSKLDGARKKYRVERNTPLPPPALRPKNLPMLVKEHGDVPTGVLVLGYTVVTVVYGTGFLLIMGVYRYLAGSKQPAPRPTKGKKKIH